MFYCFLATGFEEIEAITTVDMLRRAEVEVATVCVNKAQLNLVKGAHSIYVAADMAMEEIDFENMEGVILPGGMPGTVNLEESEGVNKALDYCVENNLYIFAICAAPQILGHKGILEGKNATCYPGFESELKGATLSPLPAVKDCRVITSKGPGATIDFAAEIITELKGESVAKALKESMQCV
ncbi:MAG: DJ-1/PfpI family protein [Clostridia bacterium]|nr:DJ-1/PfpI family protein [Clostridia bacterium]